MVCVFGREREIERERKTQMDVYQCRRERNRKSPCMEKWGERHAYVWEVY